MQFHLSFTFILIHRLSSCVKEDQIVIHFMCILVQINNTVMSWLHSYPITAFCVKLISALHRILGEIFLYTKMCH